MKLDRLADTVGIDTLERLAGPAPRRLYVPKTAARLADSAWCRGTGLDTEPMRMAMLVAACGGETVEVPSLSSIHTMYRRRNALRLLRETGPAAPYSDAEISRRTGLSRRSVARLRREIGRERRGGA